MTELDLLLLCYVVWETRWAESGRPFLLSWDKPVVSDLRGLAVC